MGLLQDCVKHRREVTRRRIDDLQYPGGGGLPLQRLVTLGFVLVTRGVALGKLTLQIGDKLLRIG
jgi:hypothetical protein